MPTTRTQIMIVGEAPGPQEDTQGRPFVGPSGEKLRFALNGAGLTDYYVTNAAKCYPSRSRTPSSTHLAACKHYLFEEIADVQPKYILTLGATAWKLFGTGGITEMAGKEVWRADLNAWVMPALHPAYILRRPETERAWLQDIYRFGELTRGTLTETPPVGHYLIKTEAELDRVSNELALKGFSFDFEANTVPWWDKGFMPYSIAFSTTGGEGFVVPLFHPEVQADWYPVVGRWLRRFSDVMCDPAITSTAHNLMYDSLAWFRMTRHLPFVQEDTMVAAHILDENQPKSLKWLGRAYLGWPQWDINARQYHALDELAEYNAYDAAATVLLRERFVRGLSENPRLRDYFYVLEMPKVRALARIASRGICVDAATAVEGIKTVAERKRVAQEALPMENPGSTKQVAKWLYEDLKLPVIARTPKGAPATDAPTVLRLALSAPQIRPLLDYRHAVKWLSTYLEPALENSAKSFDGRVHPEIRTTSTDTGRSASEFHTTPRDPLIRSMYVGKPGSTLVQGDYSQIEARLAAWSAAGKPLTVAAIPPRSMLAAWMQKRDVYKEQASQVLTKPVELITKDDRQISGKVVVLALLYKMGAQTFQEYIWAKNQISWPLHKCQAAVNAFYTLWPEFKLWHEQQEKLIQMRGYSVSEIGRMRRLPGAHAQSTTIVSEAVRQGINQPIQALANEITEMAMILFESFVDTCDLQSRMRIVGTVHDSIIVETEESCRQEAIDILDFCMRSSPVALQKLGLVLPDGLLDVELTAGAWGVGKLVSVSGVSPYGKQDPKNVVVPLWALADICNTLR